MLIVAVVGMAGAGKSEVSRIFESHNYKRIRFGDVTDEELAKVGLPLNEANEREMRESLRKQHGMDAYAKLNLPKIDDAVKVGNVVVDGLYSWEEYLLLKSYFTDRFKVAAVWSSPALRCARLAHRKIRPLTKEEVESRDAAEIVKLNKGGPIAIADYMIINQGSLFDLVGECQRCLEFFEAQS